MNPIEEDIATPLLSQGAMMAESSPKGSRVISSIVSPAIRLWLGSQLEATSVLQFQIQGSDRDILGGHIPGIQVSAEQVVYQGLHLSHIDLTATQIYINLRQILQGKPLRLLKKIPVTGRVSLSQADLNASVGAPLLKQALRDFCTLVLNRSTAGQSADPAADWVGLQPALVALENFRVQLATHRLVLSADGQDAVQQRWRLTIAARLAVIQGSSLQFTELELGYVSPQQEPILQAIAPLTIDLGSEVSLERLEIDPDGLTCEGKVNVIPAV